MEKYGQDPVPAADGGMPCTHYMGHVDDYFRFLEHGMIKTQIAGSDSHEDVHEPGYPRTYFQSPTDSPSALTTKDAVDSLKQQHALTTYGPFVTASIKGKGFGDTATLKGGGKADLDLKVQTASWFGVDRLEIYQNGHLVKEIETGSKPGDIIDYEGKVALDFPADRDSWVVIIALGLEDQNLMRKVTLDIPFGEIQISKVTSDAFTLIPTVNTFFTPTPTMPDWFPIPAYAVTNAILVDADETSGYNAPQPYPSFCSQECNPTGTGEECGNDVCLEESLCGVVVKAKCEHRIPWPGGGEAF